MLPSYRNCCANCWANHLTGFYTRATLALNGLTWQRETKLDGAYLFTLLTVLLPSEQNFANLGRIRESLGLKKFCFSPFAKVYADKIFPDFSKHFFSFFCLKVSTQKLEDKFTTQEQDHIKGISGIVILERRIYFLI